MSAITVQDSERDPAAFIRRLEAGESLLVARNEHDVAEVHAVAVTGAGPRPYGLAAGRFTVPDDFDQPLPDTILSDFEGR
jgi:antitoxin (DNA-binding transcriptional repressor) of toxin-antitoxin stability system